jgi:hypothetical protein
VNSLVKDQEEVRPKPPEGLNNTRLNSLAMGGGIPLSFVLLSTISSEAKFGKGRQSVPLGQRIANRCIKQKLLPSGQICNNIHDGVCEVSLFLRINVLRVVGRR